MSRGGRNLIVVGGGPVGLYTAIVAAQAGLSVSVVESRADPIDKACGEGLMPSAVERLASIEVDPAGRDFDGITYLSADGASRSHASFPHEPGRGVQRVVLHEALSVRAKELNVRRVHARVVGVSQNDDTTTAHLASGVDVSGDYLVGADGLHSTVRREVGLVPTAARRGRYGLRQHYLVEPWSSAVEVYWGRGAEAYVTPISDDAVGVAILGRRDAASFNERLTAFPALADRLRAAAAVGAVLGAGPLRQAVKARVRGRVLLVGDAAGYVDALTGEGLAVGFASAHALVSAVETNQGARYERDWRRVTRDYRWLTQSLLVATRSESARRLLVPTATRLPKIFTAAVGRLS